MVEKSEHPFRNAALILLGASLYTFPVEAAGIKTLLWLTAWLATGGVRWSYLFYHTAQRDFGLLVRGLNIIGWLAYVKLTDQNVPKMFRRQVKLNPNNVMFVNAADDKEWTYKQMDEYSNRVANYFLKETDIKRGETIAIYMENRPEFVGTWLGLSKVGIIPALINFNLRQKSLLHTLQVAACKGIIYTLDFESAITEVLPEMLSADSTFHTYCSRAGVPSDGPNATIKDAIDLEKKLKDASSDPEPHSMADSIHYLDPLFYIYTSGTTGLPKAVNITHIRQLFACLASHFTIGLRSEDTVYCYLPMYHSSGGQVATGSALFMGAKTVIKKKFSASSFWKDCIKYNVTTTQYIGEIARYLLATPPSPLDTQHKLRMMFGNGLRPQIWRQFITRFNIPSISEFYGATEGNSNIINFNNRIGAVGFVPVTIPQFVVNLLLPLAVIKVDKETGDPIRGSDGLCIEADDGEAGEFIGKIVRGDPIKDFIGYKDKTASNKKVLANVFKKGDLFFRSGDVLIRDEFGYLYFKDRSGDTFRWKGENVSTSEVEATVSNVLELKDATAYGVEIEGTEGRAGMVAIPAKDENEVDLDKLAKGVTATLPGYARPMFVRLVKELHMTGTYKLKKTELQRQGFDLKSINDPLYFLDQKNAKYVPLTKELFGEITSGKMKL